MKNHKITNQLPPSKPKRKPKLNQQSQSSDSSPSRQKQAPSQKKTSHHRNFYQSDTKANKNPVQKVSIHAQKNAVRMGQNVGMNQQQKNRKLQTSNKVSKRDKQKTAKSRNKNQLNQGQKVPPKQIKDLKQEIKQAKDTEKKIYDKEKKKQRKTKKITTIQGNKKPKKCQRDEQQINIQIKNVAKDLARQQSGKLAIDLKKKSNQFSSSNKTTVRMGESHGGKLLKIKQLPSFRQYCIIKGIFVPLQSTTERKCLDNIFQDTACTSPDITHSGFSKKTQHFHNISNFEAQGQEGKNKEKKTNCSEIGIQTIKAQLAHYEVLVKAAQQDIGIQYSDRLNLNSGRKSVQSVAKLKSVCQTGNGQCSRPGLLQVMMKIESLELDEGQALQQLEIEQKRHFRQVFESLISKMKSPRIQSPLNCARELESIQQISKLKYETKQAGCYLQEKREELEQLLMMRQSRQTNQFNISVRSLQQVDTSVLAIIGVFADIFCYVQMNHEENLLQTMNSLYGLSYTDKYRCISKYCCENQKEGREQIIISKRIRMEILKREAIVKALPDRLFVNLMKEITEAQKEQQQEKGLQKNTAKDNISFKLVSKSNNSQILMESKSYFWIHSKAIFDCINELLIPYRPFYPTKGDPFPWTLSPLKCLTFYSIDSESLDTVIEQLQQKITKFAKRLCGIHLDSCYYKAQNYCQKQQSRDWSKDIVFCIRREKLSRCIVEDEDLAQDPYLELEIETTCVLHELSLLITDEIMGQFLHQITYLQSSKKASVF